MFVFVSGHDFFYLLQVNGTLERLDRNERDFRSIKN